MKKTDDLFSSRIGIIIAAIGMAVGTGNIWRFPRMAAQYGGGSYLIPWIIFLILWSIPLLITEMALGKTSRGGVIKSFKKLAGQNAIWMGVYVVVCTTAIGFYYCAVTGWCLRYLFIAITRGPLGENAIKVWSAFAYSDTSVGYFLLVIMLAVLILGFGVRRGIERISRVIIPLLFIILLICAVRALTLPGGLKGLSYLFSVKAEFILNYKTWIEALAQSAWSTSAGMGLLLTYAAYGPEDSDVVTDSMAIGIGNNLASILAGTVVISTVYGILEPVLADKVISQGSAGLTFIWMPRLFNKMEGGYLFMMIFFLVLFLAAMTSLIALMELPVRVLLDFGLTRKKALLITTILFVFFGLPSTLNGTIFDNQDWVWGVGLILSGLFFCIIVIVYGIQEFNTKWIKAESSIKIGPWFNIFFILLIPLQFVFLMIWMLYQNIKQHPADWWHPFGMSLGTCLFQWTLVIIIAWLFKDKIYKLIKF